MTQKELLYVEDAISHECNILKICEITVDSITDEDLVSFFEKEYKKHKNMYEKLTKLLEDEVNER